MMVKICGITNREDALAAIEGGASALGFNFYPRSPRYVDPDRAAALISGLPQPIWKVGVFVNETPERITEIARLAVLDVVQLVGVEQAIRLPGLRVWQAIPVNEEFTLTDIETHPFEAALLDTPASEGYGGTGRTFDWSRAAGFTKVKIIIAGGLDASNVRQAIAAAHPWGVDVCSRIECSPGRKDHVKMAQFLKEAKS
jgi:phosphoribosylanthranilate isomerase